jgi:hypothetical protein
LSQKIAAFLCIISYQNGLRMNTTLLYRQIRDMIATKQFEALRALEIIKPQQFNWVTEVFENIHVKDTPGTKALIWTDGEQT